MLTGCLLGPAHHQGAALSLLPVAYPKDTLSTLLTSAFPLSIKILVSWGTKISWPSVPTGSRVTLCPCLPRSEVLLETADFWCKK